MKKLLLIGFVIFFVCNGESQTKNILSKNKYTDFRSPEKLLNKLNKLTDFFKEKEDVEFYYEGETQSTVNNDSLSLVKKRIGTKYNLYLYTYRYTPPSYAMFHDERISGFTEADSATESKIYRIKISNNYPIYHGCYDSIPNNKHENNDEFLQYYDTKININSLLKNNLNKEVYSDNSYILFTSSIDFFKFKGSDFILLSARDRRFLRNLERNYWILLKVKNKEVINSFCFIDGYTTGKDCFGDFNNDGLLDYMHWDFMKDRISIYSLNRYKFEIDKKHFIQLKQSKEQEEIAKERVVLLLYDLFDKENSKWFYKL